MTPPVYLIVTNSVLIGIVSLIALTIMIYWHRVTAGGWKQHPSGRSLMGLLAIIHLITFNAAIQSLIPVPLHIRVIFYFGLYFMFMIALAKIGLTIRAEIRKGRRHQEHQPETGSVDISRIIEQENRHGR